MHSNKVGDETAATLAKVLASNRTLKWLRLNDNDITSEGGEKICGMLEAGANTTLTLLDLEANFIEADATARIKDACNIKRKEKLEISTDNQKYHPGDEVETRKTYQKTSSIKNTTKTARAACRRPAAAGRRQTLSLYVLCWISNFFHLPGSITPRK